MMFFLRPFAPATAQAGGSCAQFVHGRQFGRFHQLADVAVEQHGGDGAIFVGEIKRQHGEIDRFLHGRGREDDLFVIAVTGALHHLEIIGLAGRDVAQARPAAHHVDDDGGHF